VLSNDRRARETEIFNDPHVFWGLTAPAQQTMASEDFPSSIAAESRKLSTVFGFAANRQPIRAIFTCQIHIQVNGPRNKRQFDGIESAASVWLRNSTQKM
jgi:hypothetical protein